MIFGISFEKMLAAPHGTVIDAIPPAEWGDYHIRAASVGTLAINLAHGVNRVNARNNLIMYVTGQGSDAQDIRNSHRLTEIHADALAQTGLPQHFNDDERAELHRLTGQAVEFAPAIILGIRPDRVVLSANRFGEPLIRTQVSFGDIDPYSQAELSDMFGVDVSTLPLTPDAQGPDFPPIDTTPRLGG